jgi:uncharacterized membrane protein
MRSDHQYSFKIMKKKRIELLALLIIICAFFAILCAGSLVNHYYFRTPALDYGMFNHAMYSYSHGNANYFSLCLIGDQHLNFLGDHFSPITILFSPLYYIFGTYALLILQNLFIVFGGIGIYFLSKKILEQEWLSLLITFHFFGLWSIYSTISSGFYNNVLAAMCLPWLFLCYLNQRKVWFLLIFVFVILAKENMSLWLIFIIISIN